MNKKKNERPKALHLWLLLLAAVLPAVASLLIGIFAYTYDLDFESLLGWTILPYALLLELLRDGLHRSGEVNLLFIMIIILVGLWGYYIVISKTNRTTRRWWVLVYAVLAISIIYTAYYCWFISTWTLKFS